MADWDILSDDAKKMLETIQQKVDAGQPSSMWEAGAELGLDRAQTEDVAMGLTGEGLLEIVNLSGGVALTEAGSQIISSFGGSKANAGAAPSLDQFVRAAEKLLPTLSLAPGPKKDLDIDLKTLRLQSERSAPLAEVVRTAFEAISAAVHNSSDEKTIELVRSFSILGQ